MTNLKSKKLWLILLPLLAGLIFLPRAVEKLSADYANNFYNSGFQSNVQAVGQIYQQGPVTPLGTACLYTAKIAWTTQNAATVQVTVRDPDSGQEKLFAALTQGSQDAPWLQAGKIYTFTLVNISGGNQTHLAQTAIDLRGFSCNGQNNSSSSSSSSNNNQSQMNVNIGDDFFSPPSMNISAGTSVTWTNNGTMQHTVTADDGSFDSGTLNPGQSFSRTFNGSATVGYHCRFHGAPGSGMFGTIIVSGSNINSGQNSSNNNSVNSTGGNFSLTSDRQTYCLGQTPTYTITAPAGWAGQNIRWNSSHNGQPISDNNYTLSSGNGQATWSLPGNSWQFGDEGQWIKTAIVNGTTQTMNLTVNNCTVNTGNSQNNSNSSSSNTNTGYPSGSYLNGNGYICMPLSSWNNSRSQTY